MSDISQSRDFKEDDEEKSLHWEKVAKDLSAVEPLTRNLPENKEDKFLIYPDDTFIDWWNLLVILLLLYTATVIPYRMILEEPDDLGFVIWDTIVDGLFFIDIIINSLSCHYDEDGNLVKSRKLIMKKYAMSWLFIDLASCIPLQLILQTEKNYSKVIRISRLPRLYRLIKMIKLLRVTKMLKSRSQVLKYIGEFLKVDAGIEKLIWFLITFMLLIHILACLWIFLGVFYKYEEYDNWVMSSSLLDATYSELYITGLYWCVTTLATVGYGDIHPYNTAERLFTTVVMVIGIFLYSYIIGSLTNMISNADSKRAKLTKKLEILDEMTQEYGFNQEFYRKLVNALESQHLNNKQELNDLVEDIPTHLKTQLMILIHQNMLIGNKFFVSKPPYFVAFVAPLLRSMKFEDQEYIYKEEDYAKEMYFIADGELDMFFTAPTTHVEVPFNQLPCSYYFGETDILFSEGKHREFGVKTTSKCHLLLLDHLDFENLLKKFEEESLEIMTLAHERNKRLLEKKDLALQAYEQQLDYKKLKSMPSEKMPELLKLSDVIGQSRSNSLISDNAEENDLKFLSTGEEPVLLNNHSASEDHSNKKVEDEKIINSKNLYKAVIEDKLVKEEDNLKVAKKKISNIEKDVQECMRILKNITDFFADMNDDMSSLKVSANYNRLKSSN